MPICGQFTWLIDSFEVSDALKLSSGGDLLIHTLGKIESNYSIPEKQKLGVRITKALFSFHLQQEGYEYVELLKPDYFPGGFVHHHKEQKQIAFQKSVWMGF